VSFNWTQPEVSPVVEPAKHVRISMSVASMAVGDKAPVEEDGRKSRGKLEAIKEETDRIFLGSLEIWEEVQAHHEEHFSNQEGVYLRAYA
jgi:hypothetical protein